MDENKFKEWLHEKYGYTTRSVSDVISRLKRVSRFTDINQHSNSRETISSMENNAEFLALSASVKSQLRRAVCHYFDFRNERNL